MPDPLPRRTVRNSVDGSPCIHHLNGLSTGGLADFRTVLFTSDEKRSSEGDYGIYRARTPESRNFDATGTPLCGRRGPYLNAFFNPLPMSFRAFPAALPESFAAPSVAFPAFLP